MQSDYVYCGVEDKGWQIFDCSDICSSAALSGLYESGTLSGDHQVRRVGQTEWKLLEAVKQEAQRSGYGQLLPKIFKNRWCWYEGRSGQKQGPFSEEQMLTWFKMGYLYEHMKICVAVHQEETPKDSEFLTLESLLLLFSQPVFAEASLVKQKPISNGRLLHCSLNACFAFVGEINDIQKLPRQLPRVSSHMDCPQSLSLDVMKEAGQKLIDGLSDRASKLFCSNGWVWYYLGQGTRSTIHGPYDGIKMSVWFRRGWLSFDLFIWRTGDIATPIDINRFRRLGDVLNHCCDHDTQWPALELNHVHTQTHELHGIRNIED